MACFACQEKDPSLCRAHLCHNHYPGLHFPRQVSGIEHRIMALSCPEQLVQYDEIFLASDIPVKGI